MSLIQGRKDFHPQLLLMFSRLASSLPNSSWYCVESFIQEAVISWCLTETRGAGWKNKSARESEIYKMVEAGVTADLDAGQGGTPLS